MAVRSPLIAIVGLPNVGKSTLFNRLIGEQRAVVEDLPGVTRDRNYARVERFSVPFVLVDTGGFDTQSNDPLQKLVQQQTLLAIEEADIILALFDGDAGVRPGDSDIVTLLREQEVPVHFLVNKIDGEEQSGKLADFYSLGVSELNAISAKHGFNVSDFIEETLQRLPNYPNLLKSHQERLFAEVQEQGEVLFAIAEAEREYGGGESDDDDDDAIGDEGGDDISLTHEFPPVFVPEDSEFESAKDYDRAFKVKPLAERWEAGVVEDESSDEAGRVGEDSATGPENRAPELIKIAIIGRPNVGKSTLLNTLVGEHRAITSEIAGTTRDSLDVEIVRDGQRYTIIDTAGLRKKQRIANRVERYSSFRALRSIADCDVAVVVLDGVEGPTMQDAKILGLAHDQGRGVVIAVNKWDLVEKDHRTVTEYKLRIREMFKFAPYAPIVFTSAISGRRCPWIIAEARRVAISRLRRVTTGDLNRVLTKSLKRSPLAVYRGRPLRMYYGVQVAVAPPRFALFFNHPKAVHFSDLRFIKNEIRENFGFEGTEIKLVAKKRGEKDLTV